MQAYRMETTRIEQDKINGTTNAIPPLEPGDLLTRAEFERRYEAMPNGKKAELIEGVVYMPSPVRTSHGGPHSMIMGWLAVYKAATPGVELYDNTTVRLDFDNEPQPDALLRIDKALGGQSQISSDEYLEGAPELVVEVAYSSVAYDMHSKLHVYRRNGVQEYVVWQVRDRRLDWFRLVAGAYLSLQPDAEGIIRSHVFPGLHLDVRALLGENLAQVLERVRQGLETAEHAEFVQKIASHKLK